MTDYPKLHCECSIGMCIAAAKTPWARPAGCRTRVAPPPDLDAMTARAEKASAASDKALVSLLADELRGEVLAALGQRHADNIALLALVASLRAERDEAVRAERERCGLVADAAAEAWRQKTGNVTGPRYAMECMEACEEIAAAIRSGEKA